MPALTHPLPRISATDALDILATHWGLHGTLRPLPGERERNFHVYTADGREFVLKIASPLEAAATIELQVAALEFLAEHLPSAGVPRVVPARDGRRVVPHAVGGEGHTARLLTWLPGRPLAEVSPHAPALLQAVGESLGSVARALSSFEHRAARRSLKWDLAGAAWITGYVDRVRDGTQRARVERIIDTFTREVRPILDTTRRGVVHNDANDYNILVDRTAYSDTHRAEDGAKATSVLIDGATDGALAPSGLVNDGALAPSGIIDFGDLLYSHPACDLAIALAYTMVGKPDPVSAACHVTAGYHRAYPLTETEIGLLYPLARTRLAVSLVNSALQAESLPDNDYLQISATGVARLLEQLDAAPPKLVEYRLREACGLEPCPSSAAVSHWLERNRVSFAALLGTPLADSDVHVHDFSVGSLTIGSIDDWRDQRRFLNLVEAELAQAGARVGIGRYDEVRAIYTTDLFRVDGNDGPEWRTVHIGIDVGAPPGTAIHAPIDATVHSLRNNDAAGDYGPTVVLEHPATAERPAFWTLYGHLNHETLQQLKVGQSVKAGDIVGWLGDVTVNGGWWPHVHVQVICDLLDRTGDFQGVARPNEREVMVSISPDPTPLLGLPALARAPRADRTAALLDRRAERIGPSLSVSYRKPLHIVRGVLQYLIDSDGRRYLDAVNNVAHVGHAHPDVVRAGQQQMAALNTNTRYLHEAMLEYADELTATLPDPLRVCYFVNSGSEANELAIRMARAFSGERDMIVVESGYHGNTTTLVDVSHYKFAGPGGAGAPDWVHTVPMPDAYRGAFREYDDGRGLKYAQAVREAVRTIRQAGRRPAAFLCESILSCGGQVPLPDGYLPEAYRHVRSAGGVCIADEVQVGLGRVGAHWWAFEAHGVVPDIVTMGKPLGNGHPLGAVVTTPDVAARFTNGMEYFNTFGGNPVSCVIGREVLRVIQREGLRERALETGNYLLSRLRELGDRHAMIGDVRGAGLFIGIELVKNRELRTPAGQEAGYVANRMRESAVLLSTDGPDHNVLKIKPPLCFDARDADVLTDTLDRVLGESAIKDGFKS
jgi:4-aminobutyrate aminotransferase-like enzyme/Ser/Thr protein kinase RdoA (MazF antagonist)/murein DD-endopeptidase MepM/ murein hydrolase activator NlpD